MDPAYRAPVGRGSWWTGLKEMSRDGRRKRETPCSGCQRRRGDGVTRMEGDEEGTRDDGSEMRTGRMRDLYVPAGQGPPSYFFTPLEEPALEQVMAGTAGDDRPAGESRRHEHHPDGPPEKFRELPCVLVQVQRCRQRWGPCGVGRGRRRRSTSAVAQRFRRSTRI